jgi:hypothetical protein
MSPAKMKLMLEGLTGPQRDAVETGTVQRTRSGGSKNLANRLVAMKLFTHEGFWDYRRAPLGDALAEMLVAQREKATVELRARALLERVGRAAIEQTADGIFHPDPELHAALEKLLRASP